MAAVKKAQSKVIAPARCHDGKLTIREAISKANERGLVILSNKLIDERLVLTDKWEDEKDVYPVWTGTLIAYGKPDSKLGPEIRYVDNGTGEEWVFFVPTEHQKATNAALVVEHGFLENGKPTYEIHKDGSRRIVAVAEENTIKLIQNFPKEDGWYGYDKETAIPVDEKLYHADDGRYLWRLNEGGRIRLLARGHGGSASVRYIDACVKPSARLGVLVEDIIKK